MILVGFEEADHRLPDVLLVQIDSTMVLRQFIHVLDTLGYKYDSVWRGYIPPIHQKSEDYFYDE